MQILMGTIANIHLDDMSTADAFTIIVADILGLKAHSGQLDRYRVKGTRTFIGGSAGGEGGVVCVF